MENGELVALLTRALDQAGRLIAGIRPEQATLPTPCASWDVRNLVNHVVDELHRFTESTATGKRGPSEGDVIGDEWSGAFRAAAGDLLEAWRQPGAFERVQRLPGGEIDARWSLCQQTSELAVHAWDIAAATGQSRDLDPDVGRLAMEWSRANMVPEIRGDEQAGYQVGPEIRVADDLALYDKLAAFAGRKPNTSQSL